MTDEQKLAEESVIRALRSVINFYKTRGKMLRELSKPAPAAAAVLPRSTHPRIFN